MDAIGKIVTDKASVNLAQGFTDDLEKLITPGNISALSCESVLGSVRDMVKLFAPKIGKNDVTFEITAERGKKGEEKPYTWKVKYSDIPALLEEVEKVHTSIKKADTLITRPNLPSTKGAKPAEVDKAVPEFDGLF